MEAASERLVGRADELAALERLITEGRPVAVVGEAGIGKTTIVRAAASRARRRLHEGGGFATLSWLPYLALRRAVSLGEATHAAAVAATVRRTIRGGVLFVDDLQWADEPSRVVIDLLLADAAIAVAIRDGEADSAATIRRVEERGAVVIRLAALQRPSAWALTRRLAPGASRGARRRIVESAGGNPLLIEALALQGAPPSWLTRALLRQVETLTAPERCALEVVARAPKPVRLPDLGQAGSVLRDRELLYEGPDGCEIRHRLIADALSANARRPKAGTVGCVEPARPPDRRPVRGIGVVARRIAAGRLADAAAEADALLAAPFAAHGHWDLLRSRALALALLGRADEADRALDDAAAIAGADGRPAVMSTWAEASLWGGLPNRALDRAERALEAAPNDRERAVASLARAWARVDLGRRVEVAEDDRPLCGVGGAWVELQGLVALADGAPSLAVERFDEAGRRWVGSSVPRELVCRWAAGEARRRAADPAAAADLRATLEAAAAIGFEPLAARVRRSLRLAGERPRPVRGPRPAGDLLTVRERQVLELVERGRTNSEIARRMGLGRPTVTRLLSNAMAKLGAQSRAHAVVLASRTA